MNNWQIFHEYKRKSQAGIVKPLVCQNCLTDLITKVGLDDDPVLYCVVCNITLIPGVRVISQMKEQILENYEH